MVRVISHPESCGDSRTENMRRNHHGRSTRSGTPHGSGPTGVPQQRAQRHAWCRSQRRSHAPSGQPVFRDGSAVHRLSSSRAGPMSKIPGDITEIPLSRSKKPVLEVFGATLSPTRPPEAGELVTGRRNAALVSQHLYAYCRTVAPRCAPSQSSSPSWPAPTPSARTPAQAMASAAHTTCAPATATSRVSACPGRQNSPTTLVSGSAGLCVVWLARATLVQTTT